MGKRKFPIGRDREMTFDFQSCSGLPFQLIMKKPGCRIIYVASRDAGYSRVKVLGDSLKARFEVTEIVSFRRSYPARLIEVLGRFLFRKRRKADVVVIGFLAQPLVPILRCFWKGPLVCDAMISLKDTVIEDRGLGNPGGLLDRVLIGFDRYMIRHCDLVFCDTRAHIGYFTSRFGPTRARFQRVWVGAPELPPGTPLWHRRRCESGPLRVFFYGSFIPLQGTDVIMKAIRLLDPKTARFRLAGTGPLVNQARELSGPENPVDFLGWQTATQLIDEMREADLCLGVFGSSEKARRVIPNKAFNAIQLGVPLLTGDSPGIRELLVPGESVLVCPMNDPEGLAEAIRWSAAHCDRLAEIGAAGHDAFVRNAAASLLADLVAESINSL